MFCSNCGKEISKESKFCRFCSFKINDDLGGEDLVSKNTKILSEEHLKKIQYASYGVFALGVLALGQVFLSSLIGVELTNDDKLGGIIIAAVIFIAGFLTYKIPKVVLPLGLLWGLYDSFVFLIQAFSSGYVEQRVGFFIMWASIRLLIVLAIFDGLTWAFKKNAD